MIRWLMELNAITERIVDLAFKLHKELGPGLFESVYEACLEADLQAEGFRVERQVAIPLQRKGLLFDEAFRADLIVEGKVLIEGKSLEALSAVHYKQVNTYLRVGKFSLGLLINFGGDSMKGNIKRFANGSVALLPPKSVPPFEL